jgi:hypothetical protein
MLMGRKTEKGRRDEEDERNEGVKDEEERGCSSKHEAAVPLPFLHAMCMRGEGEGFVLDPPGTS